MKTKHMNNKKRLGNQKIEYFKKSFKSFEKMKK